MLDLPTLRVMSVLTSMINCYLDGLASLWEPKYFQTQFGLHSISIRYTFLLKRCIQMLKKVASYWKGYTYT